MAKLTLIDGKLRINWASSESGSLVLTEIVDGEEEPCCCEEKCDVIKITYDWSDIDSRDLDTGTYWLGRKVGWRCAPPSPYMSWDGDDTRKNATEVVLIYWKRALDAGEWTEETAVELSAGWYTPAGGSGPAKVRVECQDNTDPEKVQVKNIAPGQQNGCATY